MTNQLVPSDYVILDLLSKHPDGLTNKQLAVMTGYTPHTIRQAVYKLRLAGYRIGADRVFRLRTIA